MQSFATQESKKEFLVDHENVVCRFKFLFSQNQQQPKQKANKQNKTKQNNLKVYSHQNNKKDKKSPRTNYQYYKNNIKHQLSNSIMIASLFKTAIFVFALVATAFVAPSEAATIRGSTPNQDALIEQETPLENVMNEGTLVEDDDQDRRRLTTYTAFYDYQTRSCSKKWKCPKWYSCGLYYTCGSWSDSGYDWCASSISDTILPNKFGGSIAWDLTPETRLVKQSGTDGTGTCKSRDSSCKYHGPEGIYTLNKC